MDVDNSDLDMIMCQFRTMNTNDKDHLINEFKRLSNTHLSTEGCCFYLDLAEWNLNSALWAYYEYEAASAASNSAQALAHANQSSTPSHYQISPTYHSYEIPEMQFLCDITIGEGESVAPSTNFVKTWRIKNTGNKRWPSGCKLKYVNGYNFSPATILSTTQLTSTHTNFHQPTTSIEIDLKELEPQEIADISISLKSPQQCGIYQCQYRTYTSSDQPFGDPIWLLLNVEEGGLLDCIQQLNNVNMFGNNTNENNSFSSLNNNRLFSNNNSVINSSNQETAGGSNQLNLIANNSTNHNGDSLNNKSSIFKLDSNSNLVQNESSLLLNHTLNNTNLIKDEDEKRPDFYDDMFS